MPERSRPVLRHAGARTPQSVSSRERCTVAVLGCSSPPLRVGPPLRPYPVRPGAVTAASTSKVAHHLLAKPGSFPRASSTRLRRAVKLVFGRAASQPPRGPLPLDLADTEGPGVDAMYGRREARTKAEELPDALVSLGRSTRTNSFDTIDFVRSRATRTVFRRGRRGLCGVRPPYRAPGGTCDPLASSPPSSAMS